MIILFLLILVASVINIAFDTWLFAKLYKALKD